MTGVILVAEDHPLFLQAVIDGLTSLLPTYRFERAVSLNEVLTKIEIHSPSLLLLDLDIPGANALGGVASVRAASPDLAVAILSASVTPALIAGALALGARGYFPKYLPLDLLSDGIAAVLNGEIRIPEEERQAACDDFFLRYATLSPQQCRVLDMIVDGLLNKQIAAALGISEQRVKEHVSQIMRRLGVSTRTQAAVLARTALLAGDLQST
ncbi:response regulator transcription factor [Sphingomonas sp. GM_Shp_2]|uniref:LuxR C-terminal-related transcriptional regulator n=1 Tax=Sphingomonas sp. GM_Shp_2 TaxID=2937380 RepID=UPI00226AD9FD